jgi:hypothetical protein
MMSLPNIEIGHHQCETTEEFYPFLFLEGTVNNRFSLQLRKMYKNNIAFDLIILQRHCNFP